MNPYKMTYENGKTYQPGTHLAKAFYMTGRFRISGKEWNVFAKDWEYDLHWTSTTGQPSGTHMSGKELAWWQARK